MTERERGHLRCAPPSFTVASFGRTQAAGESSVSWLSGASHRGTPLDVESCATSLPRPDPAGQGKRAPERECVRRSVGSYHHIQRTTLKSSRMQWTPTGRRLSCHSGHPASPRPQKYAISTTIWRGRNEGSPITISLDQTIAPSTIQHTSRVRQLRFVSSDDSATFSTMTSQGMGRPFCRGAEHCAPPLALSNIARNSTISFHHNHPTQTRVALKA